MDMSEPATKQDLDDAIKDLKFFVVDREIRWLKWIIGIQLAYFAITIAAMFFIIK
jgi:hypothetical protein